MNLILNLPEWFSDPTEVTDDNRPEDPHSLHTHTVAESAERCTVTAYHNTDDLDLD